ncbi:MAG: class I SAM-dependent DNA methyltransferase [Egibacteraceae bacterium]
MVDYPTKVCVRRPRLCYFRVMRGYESSTFGDRSAQSYDAWASEQLDTAGTVVRLTELAGPGPVLELGIGTGRVALGLLERGIAVHGVDASKAMVARLRAKPGGDQIPVTIGDFSELPVDGSFSLVFVVASTFYQLQSQEAQIRCVQNVARRLQPGGVFVVDAFMLDAARFPGNQGMRITAVDSDRLEVWFMQLDPAEQRLLCQRVAFTERETQLVPIPFRYAWPSELDLMARLAGLRLRERAGGWRGEPFAATSRRHLSIYELPA